VDFELAAVARARIDLADGERPAQPLSGTFSQRASDFLERGGARSWWDNRSLALAQGVEQE
jgi:hypothetical protein